VVQPDSSAILCAVDFSPGSQVAARAAAELARTGHRPLLLLHVVQLPRLSFARPIPTAEDILRSAMDASMNELSALRDDLATRGAHAEPVVTQGVPWKQIVRAAQERAAGLIVLGAHGETHLVEALLGSVAERVVRHAPCSVLVVRADATPDPA
jgi:nucleotide-binding universal stress UspA family protein